MTTHHITMCQLLSGAYIQNYPIFLNTIYPIWCSNRWAAGALPIAGQQRLFLPLLSLLSIFPRMLLILTVSASGSMDLPFPNHQTQPLENDSDTYTTQYASLGDQTSHICSSFTLCYYS